jgi:hypothetical protein
VSALAGTHGDPCCPLHTVHMPPPSGPASSRRAMPQLRSGVLPASNMRSCSLMRGMELGLRLGGTSLHWPRLVRRKTAPPGAALLWASPCKAPALLVCRCEREPCKVGARGLQGCIHGPSCLTVAACRPQAAFHVFGMELLASLDLRATNQFFRTFFRLPDPLWRGFLSSTLGSGRLVVFALATFLLAPPGIKLALMRHLVTNPAGAYLVRHYLGARARPARLLCCSHESSHASACRLGCLFGSARCTCRAELVPCQRVALLTLPTCTDA